MLQMDNTISAPIHRIVKYACQARIKLRMRFTSHQVFATVYIVLLDHQYLSHAP